jgi:acetylornithine deacetylase/succinyl-diaminopimelate desuccinylase-like protein
VATVEEVRPQLVTALGPGFAGALAIALPWIACLAGWLVAGVFTPSGTDNTPILTHDPLDIEREMAEHERLERAPHDVERDGFVYREVISATLASGGTARNVIPERFELNLNYRFAPGRALDAAVAELRAFVGDGAEVRVAEAAPSGPLVRDNAHLQRFLAINGNAVAPKQAWTDVARLGAAGIPSINLGPGLSAQAHQAGEYAEIDLLEASYVQFARFLRA